MPALACAVNDVVRLKTNENSKLQQRLGDNDHTKCQKLISLTSREETEHLKKMKEKGLNLPIWVGVRDFVVGYYWRSFLHKPLSRRRPPQHRL